MRHTDELQSLLQHHNEERRVLTHSPFIKPDKRNETDKSGVYYDLTPKTPRCM
jgi:hypothetical protein